MHVRGEAAWVGIIAGAKVAATHVAAFLAHDSLPFDIQCCVI